MFIITHLQAIIVILFMSFFVMVPVCLISIPFKLKTRLKIVCPTWGLYYSSILRYACRAKVVIAQDHRSPEFKTTPAYGLYIANHQSYIDIPLLFSYFQVPPIMKKEVMYIPVLGLMGWICGAMPVSRSSSGSRRKVFDQTRKRMVHERIGVQVYPEGTRSKQAKPKPFEEIKRTLMVFAFNEKIPVIPSSMYGTRGVLSSKGSINPGRNLGIIIHKEIDPKDFANADDFCRACWDKVLEGYDYLEKEISPLNKNLSLA